MEIIQERLEREYDLDLVTTAPSVIYKVIKTNDEVIHIDNPTNMPPAAEIDWMEEPLVKATIMLPTEYVGSTMELCQERRGIYKDMTYIDEGRVMLTYEMPLNEIIYDFFDTLKSRSKGYASLDYELLGYRKSELVKLDIMLNNEIVDALSFIVHTEKAYTRGRRIAEKVKRFYSRRAVRNSYSGMYRRKIIARETVKPIEKTFIAMMLRRMILHVKRNFWKSKRKVSAVYASGRKRRVPQEAIYERIKT
jgi:GTP-binding protein LepA